MKARVFDHLETLPEGADRDRWSAMDRHFSRAARRMRSSLEWSAIPVYVEPRPVSGKLVTGGQR